LDAVLAVLCCAVYRASTAHRHVCPFSIPELSRFGSTTGLREKYKVRKLWSCCDANKQRMEIVVAFFEWGLASKIIWRRMNEWMNEWMNLWPEWTNCNALSWYTRAVHKGHSPISGAHQKMFSPTRIECHHRYQEKLKNTASPTLRYHLHSFISNSQ
jgi:hypothetical protein